MSVHLTPSSSLAFHRPLTQTVKRILTVTNNNELPVAFKVKTTAPKLYCVRPNMGSVGPGGSAEIQVLLQAMKDEPPLDTKCRDKFLIQSAFITWDNESLSSRDFWTSLEGHESKIHQQKLKVVYLPASSDTAEEDAEEVDKGARNSVLTQGDPTSQYSNTISITIDLLKQGDALYANVRSVHEQPCAHAAESVFLPMPVTQPTGDRPITSKPVATIAPRRGIWIYLKRLMHLTSKGQKDRQPVKVVSSVTPTGTDQKFGPPPYFPVTCEHSHDEKPPHRPPSVQEDAPMFLRIPYTVPQPVQQQSQVEREPREQLAQVQGDIERWRMLIASADEPADDSSTNISDGQAEIGTLAKAAVNRAESLTPNVMVMITLLVFIVTYLDF